MKHHKRLSFTVRYVLIFGIVLLTANFALGLIILNQSNTAIRSLIDKNMLDIANTAADMMDGNALRDFEESDTGSPMYEDIVNKLSVFMNNVDIRFIYIVRQVDVGRFVFIIDPDPVDPADFGEEIVVTNGLIRAGTGVAAVDDMPQADRWGNFYSAYSPVLDEDGHVAAVLGIDFDAEWFDAEMRKHTISISVITAVSLILGSVITILMTGGVRRRFQDLDKGLTALSDNVDQLLSEIVSVSGRDSKPEEKPPELAGDEIEALSEKINTMQSDMRRYLDFIQDKAYIDALTRVGNATAYHERLAAIEDDIHGGGADFSVAVFDVNGLKEINDNHGHECGDLIISGAAAAIAGVFGAENVYRIGGDEFVVVLTPSDESKMPDYLSRVDAGVAEYNASKKAFDVPLALSKGTARYRPGDDVSYKEVFARADRRMYLNKQKYYQATGNNRRRYTDALD